MKTPLSINSERTPSVPAKHPLATAFAANLDEISRAQADVLAALSTHCLRPREATFLRTLSIEQYPELVDHTFFRQPVGWKNISDRHPVVPMTTLIELFIEAAQTLVPERKVIEVQNVSAFRWLVVSTPVEAPIRCRFDGETRVHVAIDGYCEGTLLLAENYPEPPPADIAPLRNAEPAPTSAQELYEQRWMFHGPQFQGVVDVKMVGSDAIRGVLQNGRARGALLDNAGQLFGYFVMLKNDVNRMAMPVRIERLRLFAAPPRIGEQLVCTVRIRKQDEKEVIADLSLAVGERTWATVEGWADRRFDTDERLWQMLRWPEKSVLSEVQAAGYMLFVDSYRAAPTRDQLARRYLGETERAVYDKQGPRTQRSWLNGRIAAKDAVRDFLWKRGRGALFPVEIEIENDAAGRPLVRGAGTDVRLSIAHKDDIAVALVAEGRDVGIDVERIESRSQSFAALSFTADELKLMSNDDWNEGITRLWAAKEAVGKAYGTGLMGNPLRFVVRDRTGERLLVDDTWVETRRHGDCIVSWTIT